jgi:hypothetical protein
MLAVTILCSVTSSGLPSMPALPWHYRVPLETLHVVSVAVVMKMMKMMMMMLS